MCCRTAIETAYQELRAYGHSPSEARQAAMVIFHYHHPEVPEDIAAETIAAWTGMNLLH